MSVVAFWIRGPYGSTARPGRSATTWAKHSTTRRRRSASTESPTRSPSTTGGSCWTSCGRDLDLTGAKKGCDHGQCGACTVLVDGRRVNSCLLFAVALDGCEVTTVEGLSGDGEQPHRLQQAFLERDAFQCGYCTPGQICSAAGMLAEAAAGHPSHVTDPAAPSGEPVPLDRGEIRERLSGNLCRCGAYPRIAEAVEDVIR
ncbi:4-hydroxybenzoyl-CoA reductase, gamma subunit [Streptomyces viridochromogenes DSM 40736]|uniref:4-hydroxybenzoyl-CoA reductase, gamma subunit n=1 Tax=Streptomyces viridochromogenes (strain DSM 40736 / JCM 4977 / BCRC 1201 / Tue 494) TaxID=591159 RepID=D9XES7_STRVT|nr:4-hydroxybenzoyl-CoA reductase, gamma subunit [Streptomyces viridochromogenes DSM 40736]